jgi:hypothetical protein
MVILKGFSGRLTFRPIRPQRLWVKVQERKHASRSTPSRCVMAITGLGAGAAGRRPTATGSNLCASSGLGSR